MNPGRSAIASLTVQVGRVRADRLPGPPPPRLFRRFHSQRLNMYSRTFELTESAGLVSSW